MGGSWLDAWSPEILRECIDVIGGRRTSCAKEMRGLAFCTCIARGCGSAEDPGTETACTGPRLAGCSFRTSAMPAIRAYQLYSFMQLCRQDKLAGRTALTARITERFSVSTALPQRGSSSPAMTAPQWLGRSSLALRCLMLMQSLAIGHGALSVRYDSMAIRGASSCISPVAFRKVTSMMLLLLLKETLKLLMTSISF